MVTEAIPGHTSHCFARLVTMVTETIPGHTFHCFARLATMVTEAIPGHNNPLLLKATRRLIAGSRPWSRRRSPDTSSHCFVRHAEINVRKQYHHCYSRFVDLNIDH